MKDNATIRVFEIAARKANELQVSTTWKYKQDVDNKQKVQFTMMLYDETIEEPNKPLFQGTSKKEARYNFLFQEALIQKQLVNL